MNIIERIRQTGDSRLALQALRTVYLGDFYAFAKYLIGYQDMRIHAHDEIVRALESAATRKLVIVPRGTFKSSLCSVAYPIWRLLKDPNLTILIDSELYTNSKNFLREIKGHFVSERLTSIFGQLAGNKWDESEIILRTRTKNIKEASITIGGVGTTKVGQHYQLIIGDDYNSPENSNSPEKCQKVIDHVRYNLNILNPGGEYLFIGTRYAERDILGFLLKEILDEHYLAEGKLQRGKPEALTEKEF